MPKTKTIGLVLVAILATAAVGNLVYAQSSGASKIPDYITIAEKTRDQARELAGLAASKGVNATRAYALIEKGSAVLEEAKSHFARNETVKAVSKTHVAMEYFTNAIRVIDHTFVQEIRKEETIRGLMNLITRLESRIQTIRDELARSNVSQAVKDEVNKHLDEAQRHLNLAKAALTAAEPDIDTAAKEIRGANQEIQQAIKTFREALGKRPAAASLRGRPSKDNLRGLEFDNEFKELDSLLKNVRKDSKGFRERHD
ncbi:MAG: hypothetical protein FJ358_04970 [Thaumarchaeota archaeon]|nr:hypothetical protein [Nitrososphaerota archaeon]